jgi:hypothetical protein
MKKKLTTNIRGWLRSALCSLLITGVASIGPAQAQTADLTIATFDTATGTGTDNTAGTGIGWGPSSWAWDGAAGNPAGAVLVTSSFSGASDTPLRVRFCINGGNPWYNAGTVDFSLYTNIQFDIKWDNTSDLTIDQFNSPTSWPLTITNAAGQLLLNTNVTGATGGMDVLLVGGSPNGNQGNPFITNLQIPTAASNGWVHITIPINPTLPGLADKSGITFAKWIGGGTNTFTENIGTGKFWIDNVTLGGTAGPPPPPTISALNPAGTPGLQVIMGDSSQWQRDAIVTPATATSVLWAGNGATPVTYSFTISDFPDAANHEGFEAHLYLVNRDTTDGFNETYGGCDWNVPNIAIMSLFSLTNGTFECQFQFKTNMPNANPPENAIHRPGYLNSPTALGTWSLTFTHDTNVTMSGPGGISTNFTIPLEAVQNNFSPTTSFLQFGFHKNENENDGHNLGVTGTFSNVKKSGGSYEFDDSFTGDSLTNLYAWRKTSQSYVQHVAPTIDWDLVWTLPATGYSPQSAPAVTGPWSDLTPGATYNAAGKTHAYLDANFPGGAGYFRLIKRTFSQLQVLFPGETNMPDTVTGKVGTPTAVAVNTPVQVTIHAVDNDWHIVSASGTIELTSDAGVNAVMPLPFSLTSGTGQDFVQFNAPGGWTVTATNTAAVMPAATSSTITVN